MDATRTTPVYKLKGKLAQLYLPSAVGDASLKLAWINSVCILFLIIGIIGAKRGQIAIKPAPPLEIMAPIVVEPVTLPPEAAAERKSDNPENKNDAPPIVVAIPQSPHVGFSVPTVGALAVPAQLASAPPLEPLQAAVKVPIGTLNNTGNGGERPQPPYPKIALETGEQGTVVILLGCDAVGNIVSVAIKESSGFPVLDRGTVEFIKRHWRLPSGTEHRFFQTSITYRLQF